jgi:hypothetical protein
MINIMKRAGRRMVELELTTGKTPDQTAARIMQDYCSDTPKTYKGGPDLFRKDDDRRWGLRDTHADTYTKAGVKPPAQSGQQSTAMVEVKTAHEARSATVEEIHAVLDAIRRIESSTPYRLVKLKESNDCWAFVAPTIR